MCLFSGFAHAGTIGTVKPQAEVTMPCANYGWDFTLAALYLKSSYFDYTAPFLIDDGFDDFPPRWGWGFIIGGSYHFDLGSDIVIDWYHFGKTTNERINTATEVAPFQTLYIEFRPKWDAVNLEVGQTMVLNARNDIRFHVGGQFSRISHDLYVTDGELPQPDAIHNSFNGFGPRIGVDANFSLVPGIKAYLTGAFAVLFGKPEFHTYTNNILDDVGTTNFSRHEIVPEFDGKLGSRFIFPCAQGDFNVDVGYMMNKYFHAQLYRTITSDTRVVDFALYGPYLRFNYIGYI